MLFTQLLFMVCIVYMVSWVSLGSLINDFETSDDMKKAASNANMLFRKGSMIQVWFANVFVQMFTTCAWLWMVDFGASPWV